MTTARLSIPRRFNGPPDSGNGGYCCAALARLARGPVTVSLRRPVPLDLPLEVAGDDDGGLLALDGDRLVAEARPAAPLETELPAPVTADEAHAAATRYRGSADGPLAQCFVCGLAREDGLRVFPGPVDGRRIVAAPWTPPAWSAGTGAGARDELVAAVLDCPCYFAAYVDEPGPLPLAVLARFQVRFDAPVVVGAEHVAIAWPLGVDGRKREAGSALLGPDGTLRAVARGLMIEPRQPPAGP